MLFVFTKYFTTISLVKVVLKGGFRTLSIFKNSTNAKTTQAS